MIYDKIKADFMEARKARESYKSSFLSFVLGQIQNSSDVKADENGNKTYDDDLVLSVIKNLDKKLKEVPNPNSIESEVLENYLPSMLDESQIRELLSGVEGGMKEKMAFLKENYAFRYDGKTAAKVAKE